MGKKLSEFPKELSEPIEWTGPTAKELATVSYDPKRAVYLGEGTDEEREASRTKRKADLERRQSVARSTAAFAAMDKLLILKKHYKLEDEAAEMWPLLMCMRMCIDFFPGFSIKFKEKRGRKKSRGFDAQLKLLLDVERHKRAHGGTDAAACAAVLEAADGKRPRENNVRTLQTRLSEARKGPWGSVLSKMTGAEEAIGKDDQVLSIIAKHMLGED